MAVLEKGDLMSKLRAAWEAWKRFAIRFANVQARILLTIVYVVFFAPVAMIMRLVHDPLCLREKPETMWRERDERIPVLEDAERQY